MQELILGPPRRLADSTYFPVLQIKVQILPGDAYLVQQGVVSLAGVIKLQGDQGWVLMQDDVDLNWEELISQARQAI